MPPRMPPNFCPSAECSLFNTMCKNVVKMKDLPNRVSSPASCNFRRNWTIHGLASELLWDKRGGGDRMNRRVEINPLCLASLFLALVIVTFLVLNPLNCVSSGCGSTLALIAVLLNP